MSFSRRKPLIRVLSVLMVWTLAITGIPVQPLLAAGGRQADSWDQLLTQQPGSRVRLTFVDGREVRGRLVEARADAVVLEENETGPAGLINLPAGQSLRDKLTFLRANVSAVEMLSRPRPATEIFTWDHLQTLSAGSRVRLAFHDGREVRGRLVEARADAVVLRDNQTNALGIPVPAGKTPSDALTFLRADVSAVGPVPNWPLRKKVAVAVGIAGAAVGVILLWFIGMTASG